MNQASLDLFDSDSQRQVLSVTELNSLLRQHIQERFGSVWVAGEISDLARPGSGHIYMSLKDDQGQVRAIVWRNKARSLGFELEDGMQVICQGQLDVYPARGSYQLIVQKIEPQGVGALQLALNQLRERLQAEGLFDPRRKKPLPRYPKRVAVVTSPTSAAIRDFLEVHRRRWRGSDIIIVPTRVQGGDAAPEIAAAIELAQQMRPEPDVIVVTRGGGSLEDLWCFNEEAVVRAVANARVPVVSAIGHEIDVTLCDLAADVRALTPSEAAERISPSREELLVQLAQVQRQLNSQVERQVALRRTRLDALAQRPVIADPGQKTRDLTRRIDELDQRIDVAFHAGVRRSKQSLAALTGQLEALSPLGVLSRGYSLTQREPDGAIVRAAADVEVGDLVRTRLADGELISQITVTKPSHNATSTESSKE